MKALLINLLLFLTFNSFAQRKELKSFMFNDAKIEYTRIDYSKYGTSQFFVTMYNNSPKNNLIDKNAINCLKREKNLYHTLYFFLKIPSGFKNEHQKTKLFSKFITHLDKEEKVEKFNLYLNFDVNYSIPHQLKRYNVKRIITEISPKNICKTL
ncbi:hypothetical protein [uncultured Tenacibaculum sp.]|uniref:hypothetical protein n=1 Tax=uncultured Tenacibaculum sp. TaxID=174713 RepID=UPI0026046961|nr:hypothetical protein [uncultured Tenacibaculum sp.]